jgi:6-phosphogluconolactonase
MREVRAGPRFVEEATDLLFQTLSERLMEQPRVSLALSGGSTPWPVFRRLAEAPIDWRRVDIYQVDERVAPLGDPARNLTGLSESLLDRATADVHPMPVESIDLARAAKEYAAALPARFDVVHLGLGDDGHTASLVPGDPVLDVTDSLVGITQPYRGHPRMTLTFPALARSHVVVWIVAESGKSSMLRRLRDADRSIPAGRVPQNNAILVTDEKD